MAVNKTRAELIAQVLYNLGRLANGAPEAEDSNRVDRVIDATVAMLSARDVYTVADVGIPGPDYGAIEPEIFLDLCHIVAAEAAPAFNMAADEKLLGLAQRAERRMREIAMQGPSRYTLKVVYY